MKREWRALGQGRPGSRFQQVNRIRAADARLKWVWMLLGAFVMAVGLIALPLPGPGSLLIAVGAALIARESAVAARIADRIEVRLRSSARWASRSWRRVSPAAKAALVALGLALISSVALGAYRFFLGG